MASESDTRSNELQSILERLITSRNRELSMFLPFLLGSDPDSARESTNENSSNQDRNSRNNSDPQDEIQRDRIVLINPLSQEMVVIEGTGLDSLIRSVQSKDGQPPASKSAIDAMPSVNITEEEGHECVICLENCEVGESVKEMPCKHRFHGGCIEKWLGLHGSCPVCRFNMPVEEDDVGKKSDDDESERRRDRRGIWVSFSFGRGRRRNNEDERESTNESNSGDLGNQSDEIQ